MQGWNKGWVAGVAILATFWASGPASNAGADESSEAATSMGVADDGLSHMDDDDSAINDWDEVRIAIPLLQTKLGALFGGRYAGGWLDRTRSPSVLVVLLEAPQAADALALDQLTGRFRARFEIVAATYSGARLELFKSRIEDELATRSSRSLANVDQRGNLIVVDIDNDPSDLRSAIEARGVPSDAFEIQAGLRDDVANNASRDSYPPHEGALRVVIGTVAGGYSACTSAWLVKSQTVEQYFGLTAGHCADAGDDVYIGSTRLSAVSRVETPTSGGTTNTDVARYSVALGQAAPRVLRTTALHRDVTAPKWNYSDLYLGLDMCFIGQASADDGVGSCGPITYFGSRSVSGGTLSNAFCFAATVNGIGGDSGAPIFSIAPGKAHPAGIEYGTNPNATWTCGTMVAAAGSAMGTQLVYA